VEAESEEEEEVVVGKQNYPVGWDGKPIPYWLYKLHGLGIMYQCEICGNQTYQGRRAFERHFQEWRHAHGMRCLGIPNTKHFHEITKIKDAQDRALPPPTISLPCAVNVAHLLLLFSFVLP
jgi:splicing factor 3A subunit 3